MGYGDVAFPEGTLFLVTGGAGFIGSNLCHALLAKGCRVRCLDNLSTGSRANVDFLLGDSRYEFVEGDIRNLSACETACAGVSCVLHQAAWGSVGRSLKDPLGYCENNIRGTLNVFEAARRCGVPRVVYASSSSVYGDDESLPKVEGCEGTPLSPYALTKRCDEEWARQYTGHFGLSTVGLRYFNVFGRRQSPEGPYAAVIPRFVSSLLAGKEPVIYGDGLQSRNFTYVENVVEANLRAAVAPAAASGEVFNIAAGGRVTLLELLRVIEGLLGVSAKPRFEAPRAGDIRHSCADISKARRILGYAPSYDFQDGIREAIGWYRGGCGCADGSCVNLVEK